MAATSPRFTIEGAWLVPYDEALEGKHTAPRASSNRKVQDPGSPKRSKRRSPRQSTKHASCTSSAKPSDTSATKTANGCAAELRRIYTAPDPDAAAAVLEELEAA